VSDAPENAVPPPPYRLPARQQPGRRWSDARWESAVERAIREAQERGAFDRLPGQGKPLVEEAWDPEMGTAHHVLKQAGETLPWIALGRDVEAAEEALRDLLERTRRRLAALLPGARREAERVRARERYLALAADLDTLLGAYNFAVPVRRLDKGRLPPAVAASRFDAACPQ
jgi:hypothetical protein